MLLSIVGSYGNCGIVFHETTNPVNKVRGIYMYVRVYIQQRTYKYIHTLESVTTCTVCTKCTHKVVRYFCPCDDIHVHVHLCVHVFKV